MKTGQLRAPTTWSIGIYAGRSPLELEPYSGNPVLSARDVTDVDAAFVADPFMVYKEDQWFMFFEVMNRRRGKGEIGVAVSEEGRRWTYRGIVISAAHHLSYPFVFASGDEVFMVPEEGELSSIRLFRAVQFPHQWEPIHLISEGKAYEDTTLFQSQGDWWAISSTTHGHTVEVHLFHSERLDGEWLKHPQVSIADDVGRSGGRITELDGMLLRFVQASDRSYGESIRVHRIDALSRSEYSESPISTQILGPSGKGWNATRMHTLDPHMLESGEWIACVDGRGFSPFVTQLSRLLPVDVLPYEYPRTLE